MASSLARLAAQDPVPGKALPPPQAVPAPAVREPAPQPQAAPDPAIRDTFQQAKAAWAVQGDRAGASAKFEAVLAALEPAVRTLDPAWIQVLCETYNWMATLDDRLPAKRERAPRYLDTALGLNPDFEIDRTITNARLQAAFDNLRAGRLGRLNLSLDPPEGVLTVDGRPRPAGMPPPRYLPPGPHTLGYARPGFGPVTQQVDLALREPRTVALKLERTSSVLTVFSSPAGAQVELDGKPMGHTSGQAGPDLAVYAERLGVPRDQISAGFNLDALAPGPHVLTFRLPCYQPSLLDIGAPFTTPFADHVLEPVKLVPSRAVLNVLTSAPGGELFLSGQSYGPVPVHDLAVCAQTYDLQVRFPAGSYAQRVQLGEGQTTTLAVRPRPRLTYVGFDGATDFAGRERITGQLAALGARLPQISFQTAAAEETPEQCVARLQAGHDTELVLRARAVPGHPIHQVELSLATLGGEAEQVMVKPLESDPLGQLVARLGTPVALSEPWCGLTLVDLGPGGPWVLQADGAAQKAGVQVNRSIQQVNGKPVTRVAEVRQAMAEAASHGGKLTVTQGEAVIPLAVTSQPVELPVNAAQLCYPLVLADLRLRAMGATGDEAALLRLQQALALMHFREYDQALEVLRDARLASTQGVSQGTLDYYTGVCLLHMGDSYLTETLQAFNHALSYPHATLFGPGGPLLAPLARQALADLHP
jgi:hypothetical protein